MTENKVWQGFHDMGGNPIAMVFLLHKFSSFIWEYGKYHYGNFFYGYYGNNYKNSYKLYGNFELRLRKHNCNYGNFDRHYGCVEMDVLKIAENKRITKA